MARLYHMTSMPTPLGSFSAPRHLRNPPQACHQGQYRDPRFLNTTITSHELSAPKDKRLLDCEEKTKTKISYSSVSNSHHTPRYRPSVRYLASFGSLRSHHLAIPPLPPSISTIYTNFTDNLDHQHVRRLGLVWRRLLAEQERHPKECDPRPALSARDAAEEGETLTVTDG